MRVGRTTGKSALFYLTAYSLVINLSHGLTNNLQVLSGSLTIAGIFEVQTVGSGGECGEVQVASVMSMEAIRWYLQSVNENGTLPFKIGFSAYKTCGILGRAGDAAVDIISRYRRSNETYAPEDLIIGVLGPEYSSETQVVSSILGSQTTSDRLLQVGFSSTSSELNDRVKYPNYYRVVVESHVQITSMLKLMFNLKWSRIAIMYVNDTYGQVGAKMLQTRAAGYHLCISKMNAIEIDSRRQVKAANIREILQRYVTDAPHIEGVVYFGNDIIANQVMQIFDSINMKDVPIFILSESNLDTNVFKSATGKVFPKTKGTLALSLPYIEVTDFKRYWESLFTNKSVLQTAAVANPYLKDVFRRYTACNFDSADCDALDENEVDEKALQSVYVHYAIYAAHTLVEALRRFNNRTCNSECDTIDEFKANFKPNLLIEAMDGLSVTYGGTEASFKKESPNIHFADEEKEYEVYNFRKDPADVNKFTFVNVGYMSNGYLALEVDTFKDYDPGGLERNHSNLRRGQCPVGDRCAECIDSDISEINYHIPGDLYVIGLVSINNNNQDNSEPLGCGKVRARHGYQMSLSLEFALKTFETNRWFSDYKRLFAGKSIGLIVINSCNNALEVVPKILELHSKGLLLLNGTYMTLKHRILGYVGGQAADVSEPAASQLTKLKFIQISYASTNPVLSNKELYPYFLRIVSPDTVQAKAMIDIVKDLGGKYIQLVYSEGAYGEGGRDAVLAAALVANICVIQSIKFIGSEAWGKNMDVLKYDITQGAVVTAVEMDRDRTLEEFIKDQKPKYNESESNPWLEDYIQNRQDCYFNWSYDKQFSKQCTDDILPLSDPNFQSDPWCIFVFNTMLAFLKGAAIFYNNKCGSPAGNQLCADFVDNPDEFFSVLRNVKMDIYGTGDILIFDENGDGLMGYKIYNIQARHDDKTAREYSEVGSYSPRSGLKLEKENIEYPTSDPILSACPNQLACEACLGDESTSDESDKEQNTEALVLGALVGVLTIAIVIMSVVYFLTRRRKQKNPDDAYITPTYMCERLSAEGQHAESDVSYVTPSFVND